ncbi:NTP transferase domain-containing protein, partial [bacterium]|nr:NTP transferase domain-containing protein [bacterium]
MIKKVVVAAAGRGTRMLHLSANKPKHLIKVNGKPFLYYLMNNLKKAGLTEIYMIIGYKKRMIEKFLTEYKDEFNITVINQFDE